MRDAQAASTAAARSRGCRREQVLGQDHVVALRPRGQVHRERVDQLAREPSSAKSAACTSLTTRRHSFDVGEHVRLVDRPPGRPPTGQPERPTARPARSGRGRTCTCRGRCRRRAIGAEVEPARQLAHDHQVDDAVAHGAQVGERVELLAQSSRPCSGRRGEVVPAGPADGARSTASEAFTAERTCAGRGRGGGRSRHRRTAGAPGAGARRRAPRPCR